MRPLPCRSIAVMKKRFSPEKFMIPVDEIKRGFYSDKYFIRTREVLLKDRKRSRVLMQVFTRADGVICGIDEAVAIIRTCAASPQDLLVHALFDGDSISKGETVLTIEGDYSSFAHLETVYLGVLARGSSIASAVHEVVEASAGKPVLFFAARFDHYRVQHIDGYAAFIGGAQGVSTDANGILHGIEGMGTIPHGLIAAYAGDTLAACKAFSAHQPPDVDLIALVDFQNDCIGTSLRVARYFGEKLWGVRIDTAGDMRDESVTPLGTESLGVCPELVWKLRRALDAEGFHWVKIIVSGGFNRERLQMFAHLDVPFDAVGIGAALLRKKVEFTADVVRVNGEDCAKRGRRYNPNTRLSEA
jgi:nicotinate phosphoribosyltransferase